MGIESRSGEVPPLGGESDRSELRVETPEYSAANERMPEITTENWWETAEWIDVTRPVSLPSPEEISARILAVDSSDEATPVLTYVASEIMKLTATKLDTQKLVMALFDSFLAATEHAPEENRWGLFLLIEPTIDTLVTNTKAAQEMKNHFRALRVYAGALK